MIYLDNTTQSQQVYIPRQVIQTATTREINYITSGDVINIVDEKLEPYYTSAETDTQIENAVAAESARCESTYAKISDIPDVSDFVTSADVKSQVEDYNYVNSADVKTQIEDYHYITSGDLPDVSEFITSGQAQEQINQSLSGYATEQWVEDKHYLTEHQSLSGYASEEYVDNAVGGAIDYVDDQFSSYSQEFTGYLAEKQDITAMTAYYTSAETDTQIENAIAAEIERADSTYATPSDIPDVSDFVTSADLASYALSADVDTLVEDTIAAESARTESTYAKINDIPTHYVNNVSNKGYGFQVEYSDGTYKPFYVSKINGKYILNANSGQIETNIILPTSADVKSQVEAYNYITSADLPDVSDFITSADVETQITGKNYVTSATVQTQIDGNLSAYTPTSNFATINGSGITNGGNIVIQGGGSSYTAGDGIDITNDVISVTGRQETLVSGTNIKTINNQSLLGSGNIVIQGGGGGNANIIELTQAEYDALTAYTEDALYVITDAEEVDLNDYATSADVATKADKANVAANSQMKFPTWNSQGIITGTTGNTLYQNKQFMLNGRVADTSLISTNTYTFGGFYAPTTAGSSGQILQSNGSGAPSWSSFKFWYGSQNDYDAITTKDPNCIYFVQ